MKNKMKNPVYEIYKKCVNYQKSITKEQENKILDIYKKLSEFRY